MQKNDSIKLKGSFRFEGFDENGKKVFDKSYNNIIVQSAYTAIFKMLKGETHSLTLSHMATGTGTTAALRADTALEMELFRKAITSQSYTNLRYTCKLSLAASESVATIREIGVFADTVLFSRCNVNIVKTNAIQLLITYTITTE